MNSSVCKMRSKNKTKLNKDPILKSWSKVCALMLQNGYN